MNADQKRAAVPVAIILGVTFVAGMIMSVCFVPTKPGAIPAVVVGATGPFLVFLVLIICEHLLFAGVIAALLAVPIWHIVAGIRKGRRAPALCGAVGLALLWAAALSVICVICCAANSP